MLTILCRCKLANVQGNHHSSTTNTEPDDEPAHSKLRNRVRGGLQDCSNDEYNASGPDRHLSSEAIGSETSSDSSNQSSATGQGSHQLLFAR